jgi:hypothetical protein
MEPVTSKVAWVNDLCTGRVYGFIWLGDNVIMEDYTHVCVYGWEFPTQCSEMAFILHACYCCLIFQNRNVLKNVSRIHQYQTE